MIAGSAPCLGVDDEDHGLGVADRGAHLLVHEARELTGILEVDSTGVDQRERDCVPVGLDLVAVAGDAGQLVHDRLSRTGQAVDQRGLADVRITDDRDLHGGAEASAPDLLSHGEPAPPLAPPPPRC